MDYKGPGNTAELSEEEVTKWQAELSSIIDNGIMIAKNEVTPPAEQAWIFNPFKESLNSATSVDIKWNAFPRRLLDNFGTKRAAWREADSSRARQEEYCEWEVSRNTDNTISRVTFTTEAPDYYFFLFRENPALLVDLYQKHVSPDVQLEDIVSNGGYARVNKWNTPEIEQKRGILMHMAHGPNTFAAAVNLSAEATWPSIDSSGNLITDEQGLIDCRGYGARERHSDPHIGAQINSLTRSGKKISFAGPTGLYIDNVDFSGFETPDESEPSTWMRIVRGDENHVMRVIFEAPKSSDYSLSDLKIDGIKVFFGGQIAEKLTIRITGIAKSADTPPFKINCSGEPVVDTSILSLEGGRNNSRRVNVEFIESSE